MSSKPAVALTIEEQRIKSQAWKEMKPPRLTVSQWFSSRHLMQYYTEIDRRRNGDPDHFVHRSNSKAKIRVVKRLTERLRLEITEEARLLLIEDAKRVMLNGAAIRDRHEAEAAYHYLTGTKPWHGSGL